MARQLFTVMLIVALGIGCAERGMGQLQIVADQGSTRSMSTVAPSLTVTNGVPGFFAATTQRPFVTSFVPIVGGYGGDFAPVYGPAAVMPQSTPVISTLPERIARLKQNGYKPARSQSLAATAAGGELSNHEDAPTDATAWRVSAIRERAANGPLESVAAIRQRLANEEQANVRKIDELRRRMHEAQSAGKSQVARIYQQQIDRRARKSEFEGAATVSK